MASLPSSSSTASVPPTPSTAYSHEPMASPHCSQPTTTETDTPDRTTAPGTKNKQGNSSGHGFGPNAPSRYLLFPASANITAIELLTFLPNSVHCAEFLYRFFANGGSYVLLYTILNQQRSLLVEWSQRRNRQVIYETMRRAGYEQWGNKARNAVLEKQDQAWNEANISVKGYKAPGQVYKKGQRVVESIPFRDLAADVRQVPQGDDALDMTRMIQHCVQNPHDAWLYPRDWDALLSHLGGPSAMRHEHTDREAFKRWIKVKSSQEHNLQPTVSPEAHEKDERSKKRKMKAVESSSTAELTSGTEAQPQKRRRERQKEATEIENDTKAGTSGQMKDGQKQVYQRSDEYVAPPANSIIPFAEAYAEAVNPENEALTDAFFEEGQLWEDDPYSAYAFGGPRHTPPYRWLYLIHLPDPADYSGWAENLRWAFVQNSLYSHPQRPDAWNESPEHMEQIVQIRRELYWMSDEYQEQLSDYEDDSRTD
ncbi:hypothetical protein GMOD_00000043 [Pyrenophora seminiperda CCB06]|uniref:Uncharacterized protein n=1 Tax=Pyrenophora seminiperda CCB06 TaxID=1302712 RepID=A0A3M7M689_9PLEO|nr:hypothetical protein GMOD_00000043 [Pyrenophora seminiperda CCB06]